MRIALVAEKLPENQDPIGSVVLHLVDHLETHGHSCLLLTAQGIPLLMGRTRVLGLSNPWEDGEPKTGLYETLKDFQPDLLHAVQPVEVGVKASRVSREMGIPTVTSHHGEFLELARLWGFVGTDELMWSYFQTLYDSVDLALVPSFINKKQLKDLGFDRAETWGRGVDCDLFSPRRRSEAWRRHLTDGEPSKTLLLYAGRLAPEKHVELLKPIINVNTECRLAVIGDGPELRRLRDYFDGTPTLFTGQLDQGDLAEAYASADLFVHPASTVISQVTTLEAMASGLPVLAPQSSAIVDFAVHGENALLYHPGETEQAASYVHELAEKPRLRADLSRIARQTGLGRNWHIICDDLLTYYERLAEVKASSALLPSVDLQMLPVS